MSTNLFQKIKNSNLVEIIRIYLPLTKRGANYLAICPFHNDSKPSLTINENKNIWKCFACGESGDAITFVAKYKHLSSYQAAIRIAKDLNWDPKLIDDFNQDHQHDEKLEKLANLNQVYLEFCQNFLLDKKNKLAQEYLEKRQIDANLIAHFGIGYNPNQDRTLYELLTNENAQFVNLDKNRIFSRQDVLDCNLIQISSNGNIYDTFRNRVIFSIKNDVGQIVGFSGRSIDNTEPKYLNTKETNLFKKNQILYNWNTAKANLTNGALFITEGFMDVIALYKTGIKNAVATMGTAFSDYHLQMLKKTIALKSVILAFDNDDAGLEATIKTGVKIGKNFNVYVVKPYDKQFKDWDELLNGTNPDMVSSIVNNQIHFSLFYLQTLLKKYNLNNLANKQDFLIVALETIKKYGNILYKNDYLDFLINVCGYEKDILSNQIDNSLITNVNFVPNKTNKSSASSAEQKCPKYLSAFIHNWQRLIMACLINSDAVNKIKKHYPFYPKTKLYKKFDEQYDLFNNMLNILCDYYLEHPQIQGLTLSNYDELKSFIIENAYSIDTPKYLDLFHKFLSDNTVVYKQYIYSENNLLESFKDCAINDLSIRQCLVILTYDKKINHKFDTKTYDDLVKKIDELKQWNLKENVNGKTIWF